MTKNTIHTKSILELSHTNARKYFLQEVNYCNLELPTYITFSKILNKVDTILNGKDLRSLSSCSRTYGDINYKLLCNKDGKYAWRPLQLIHPALYVSLVHKITEKENWNFICNRFNDYKINKRIVSLGIPVISLTKERNKAEQVLKWWQDIEQKSIELSLDYEWLLETDITDCYCSIYTHSIAWALHGKDFSKNNQKEKVVGNIIDWHIQDMCYGQTNSIPQGSVLMDFIAEIVLGYSDLLLTERILNDKRVDDYKILRYRDDYRIFVNNSQDGEYILKQITEVMTELGLKLNSSKTSTSNEVIRSSIKKDKYGWITRHRYDRNPEKRLLIIFDHAKNFPNSGSLVRALNDYYSLILKNKGVNNEYLPLISIVADIAFHNPKTYPICSAILSKLLSFVETNKEKIDIMERIMKKFSLLPNTGYIQIWLQRITLCINNDFRYNEHICKLVSGKTTELWNNDWISSKELKLALSCKNIIDKEIIRKIKPVIQIKEVALFISKKKYYG